MTESRKLIGQGGAVPSVTDYADLKPVDGPYFGFVREVKGLDEDGVPSWKVAGYFAAETGKRGDAVYPLNVVIQRNPGHPKSDQIGLEINVNNNAEPLTLNEPHWLDGLAVASGGSTNPGVGVHIGSTGEHNRFVTALKISAAKEIGIEVGNPLGLSGTLVARQMHGKGDTILLQRNNDTNYGGSFLRCLTADGKGELFRIDFDGSVWCRGTKVIG